MATHSSVLAWRVHGVAKRQMHGAVSTFTFTSCNLTSQYFYDKIKSQITVKEESDLFFQKITFFGVSDICEWIKLVPHSIIKRQIKQLRQNRKFKYRQPYLCKCDFWLSLHYRSSEIKGTQLNSEVNIFLSTCTKIQKILCHLINIWKYKYLKLLKEIRELFLLWDKDFL